MSQKKHDNLPGFSIRPPRERVPTGVLIWLPLKTPKKGAPTKKTASCSHLTIVLVLVVWTTNPGAPHLLLPPCQLVHNSRHYRAGKQLINIDLRPSNWWFEVAFFWWIRGVSHLPSTRARASNPQTTNPNRQPKVTSTKRKIMLLDLPNLWPKRKRRHVFELDTTWLEFGPGKFTSAN